MPSNVAIKIDLRMISGRKIDLIKIKRCFLVIAWSKKTTTVEIQTISNEGLFKKKKKKKKKN